MGCRHRHRRAEEKGFLRHRAENAAAAVDAHGADVTLHGEIPLQFPRLTCRPLLHRLDRSGHNRAVLQRHQLGGIHIGDAVTQSAVRLGGGIVVSHRAHTCHGVADPHPQTPHAVCALLGRVAEEYSRDNDVSGLLCDVQQVLSDMRTQALPADRDEFESRAVLYYVLLRTEDFLLLKRQFHEEYAAETEGQRG